MGHRDTGAESSATPSWAEREGGGTTGRSRWADRQARRAAAGTPPRAQARTSNPGASMPTVTKPATDWQSVARAEAAVAYEWFAGRPRGVVRCTVEDALVVYSTHPYVGHPTLRDEGWALFRRWLASRGIAELGFACYPTEGVHAGQTQVMLVAAGGGRAEAVEDEWARLHEYAIDRIWAEYAATPGQPLGRPA